VKISSPHFIIHHVELAVVLTTILKGLGKRIWQQTSTKI